MNSKTKLTLSVTAMVAITLLAVVSIMAVFAARQQSFSTSISVVYHSTSVEGTASAQWKLGSYYVYDDGTVSWDFYSEWQNMDSNGVEEGGQTEIDLSSAGPLSLSPQEPINLSDEKPAVVLKYSFTNSASHPFTLNFNYQPKTNTKNIISLYNASSQEMDDGSLENINNNFTNTLETTVLGGTDENIYILLKIDDWGSDSVFDGTFNIKLDGITSNFEDKYIYLYDGTNAMLTGAVDKEATTFDASTVSYKGAPVTAIGDGAFQNNTSLQTVTLNGVEEIGSNAFKDCTAITTVTVGESVEKIGKMAFYGLTNLETLNYNADILTDFEQTSYTFCSSGKDTGVTLTIGENVTNIPECCFGTPAGSYLNISTLNFGKNVKNIGSCAFYGCLRVGEITLKLPDGLTSIMHAAFSSCPAIKSIIWSPNIKEVVGQAFLGSGLTELDIPAGLIIKNHDGGEGYDGTFRSPNLTNIKVDPANERYTSQDESGNECNALIDKNTKTLIQGCASTKIPEDGSVTIIGEYAFYGLEIPEICIPECITTLKSYAFGGLKGITKITIPESISEIGSCALNNMYDLTTVEYNAINCSDNGSGIFGPNSGNAETGIKIIIGEGVKHIGAYFFYGSRFGGWPNLNAAEINSVDVYKELMGNDATFAGGLLACLETNNGTLKVKADIVDGNDMPEYLQTNYTKGDEVDGYYTFTFNGAEG